MKKMIIRAAVAITLVAAMFIPNVQTFAISAMSVFRIGDVRTITVTLPDIEEMAAYFEEHRDLFHELMDSHWDECEKTAELERPERDMSQFELSDISEFEAFSVRLPQVQDEAPNLFAFDANVTEFTLDVTTKNMILAMLPDMPLFDTDLNGEVITLHSPAVLFAEYDSLMFAATQMPYVEAPVAVKESLQSTLLALPFLSTNLRSQLAAIPLDNRDVYLPVIMGLGREVSVGRNIGYIYSSADLSVMLEQMPGNRLNPVPDHTAAIEWERQASVLVWVEDGVLYLMAGPLSDSELVRLARNIN